MTAILVNVGLERRSGGQLAPSTVLRAFRDRGFAILDSALHRSDSEDTVVLSLKPSDYTGFGILDTLDQRALAMYWPSHRKGAIIYRLRTDWGAFDPAKFILLDGSRASSLENSDG